MEATPKVKSIQPTALALLVVGGAVNDIDRAILAVAAPLIPEELGLSFSQMGYLLSARTKRFAGHHQASAGGAGFIRGAFHPPGPSVQAPRPGSASAAA